jgi:zinc transport system ATP-binding protein
MDNPILQVHDLSFAFHDLPVIQEANFTINEGEMIALFGPNGGGKTTLLHLLMGLYTPTKGQVLLFDRACQKARDTMGFVPQHFNYDREFPISMLEVVLGGVSLPWHGRVSPKDKKKAQEILESLGLKKLVHRPFAEASGGQQQRALFARALINDPKILFLDEPTSSIDADAKKVIYELIASLKGKMTIILVSHDLQNVINLADRLFCVQTTVLSMEKQAICSHIPLGLYHEKNSQPKKL